MKTILVFLLILTNCLAYSQTEWAPIGAKWYYTNPNYDYSPPSSSVIQCVNFESLKDTIIGQKSCRKISVRYCRNSAKIGDLFLHQNKDSIFYYNGEGFSLLYNFSAKLGDTIVVHDKKFKPIPAFLSYQDSIEYFKYKIVGLDSIDIGGKWYRRQHVASLKPGYWGFKRYPAYITEKIGSINYFLGRSGGMYPEQAIGTLRCYHDSQMNYKDNECDSECDFTTNSEIIERPTTWYFAHSQLERQFIDTISTGAQTDGWTDLWYHGIFENGGKTFVGKVKCSQNNDSVWYIGSGVTKERLIFNLNLNKGDTFDLTGWVVDAVFYKNNRKYIEFNGNAYWGDKIQFIEGVGPNLGFLYASNLQFLHPYVVCQFQWLQKVYSADNNYFKDCDFLVDNINQTQSGTIKVLPVPFNDELKIQLQEYKQGHVCILDLLGRVVYYRDYTGNAITVNTTSFNKGIYLLKIFTGRQYVTYKILKQ